MQDMRTLFPTSFYIGTIILVIMGSIMFSTINKDVVTTDEAPHILAGYTYLKFQEFRINPEHPPLIKDIAAFPLLFQDLNFPSNSESWTINTNDQWSLAPQFLFESGNSPGMIIWWGRVGPIFLTLLFGALLFVWARRLFGLGAATLALLLFAFSPTLLAHGRLVTTDVAAAFGFFISIWAYLWFLKNQRKRNFFILAAILAVGQLLKFSLVLFWPYAIVITILWAFFKDRPLSLLSFYFVKRLLRYGVLFVAIGLTTLAFIYPVYQFHVWNYEPARQIQDIENILPGENNEFVRNILVWSADKPVLQAYSEYFLGVSMVYLRVGGGNTAYFFGDVANTAWKQYFPVVFALKVPIALLAFITLSTLLYVKQGWRKFRMNHLRKSGGRIISENFTEISFLIFIVFYWGLSIMGNLNIGVRHIIPTLPFMYLLIAGAMHRWIKMPLYTLGRNPLVFIAALFTSLIKKWIRILIIVSLLIWYIGSSLSVYPHYIAYFNEFAGGPSGGHRYVVDSNLDWGQDLERLAKYTKENNIKKIKLYYFGGSKPEYYLTDRYEPYWPDLGPTTGWLAISATLLKEGQATAIRGYTGSTTHFNWLKEHEPVTVIGHSIFVFYIPE